MIQKLAMSLTVASIVVYLLLLYTNVTTFFFYLVLFTSFIGFVCSVISIIKTKKMVNIPFILICLCLLLLNLGEFMLG